MATQAGIVNAALQLAGAQDQITALNDGSVAANAANVIYSIAVQLLLRQLDPDFARTHLSLGPVALTIPSVFTNGFAYPGNCLHLRQVAPPPSGNGSLADPFDPQPIRGEVAYDPGLGIRVILTNQANPIAIFTTQGVTEAQFDSAFTEALIRRLANPLAMALAGRPDFARELLEEAERYAGMQELADENADGQV